MLVVASSIADFVLLVVCVMLKILFLRMEPVLLNSSLKPLKLPVVAVGLSKEIVLK